MDAACRLPLTTKGDRDEFRLPFEAEGTLTFCWEIQYLHVSGLNRGNAANGKDKRQLGVARHRVFISIRECILLIPWIASRPSLGLTELQYTSGQSQMWIGSWMSIDPSCLSERSMSTHDKKFRFQSMYATLQLCDVESSESEMQLRVQSGRPR